MSYEYIAISGSEANDRARFRYFQDSDYSIHRQFIKYSLPIYRYYERRSLTPFYFLSRWLFEIQKNFRLFQRVGAHIEDSTRLTSHIYHDTKLRAKYSVLLTLDPEYLCSIVQHTELLEDLRTAGYEVQLKGQ